MCPIPTLDELQSNLPLKGENKIKLLKIPISTTSVLIEDDIILDPCLEEENLAVGSFTFIFDVISDELLLIEKCGGKPVQENDLMTMIGLCQSKAKSIYKCGLMKEARK